MQKKLLLFAVLFFQEVPGQTSLANHGVRIAYTDTREGDTALLFVHGWCLNRSYRADQVSYFRDRYRVIAIDLPGFGESGRNRTEWTTTAFAADIDTVIAQLHLKHVILIGHSMAGHIVLEAAIHAPGKVIGLVGVENFKHVGHVQSPEEKAGYAQGIEHLINSDTKPTDTTGLTAHLFPFQLLSIHDTGHFPMVEKAGDFNVLLDQALSEMAK